MTSEMKTKLFNAFHDWNATTLLNEEMDDFETCLSKHGLKIEFEKTMIDLLDKICLGQKKDANHCIIDSSKE